jgi:hypothetical protein
MKIIRRGRRIQDILAVARESHWWYVSWIPFQISATECAVPLNRMATGIYTVDFGLGFDMAVLDNLDGPPKQIMELGRTALERHPRSGKPVQMSRWAPHVGFVPLGAKRADGTPHPHAGTGFGVGTVLAFPCDEAGNLTCRVYCDTGDVYCSQEVVQLRYDGAKLTVEHSKRVENDQFLPGLKLNGNGFGVAVPDGDDLLYTSTEFTKEVENMRAGVTRWRFLNGRWKMVDYVPVATEPGGYYSEPTLARDADGTLLFSARTNQWNTIQVWRSTDGGHTWTCLLRKDNMRPVTPISINTTGDGRAYVAANPFCPDDLDSRGIKRYANALRERICLWPLSDDRKRLLDPVVLRDGPSEFGIPPSGSIWAVDHPMSTTLRMADGKWRHVISYRLLDLAEILDHAPQTPITGSYCDEIELGEPFIPPWHF